MFSRKDDLSTNHNLITELNNHYLNVLGTMKNLLSDADENLAEVKKLTSIVNQMNDGLNEVKSAVGNLDDFARKYKEEMNRPLLRQQSAGESQHVAVPDESKMSGSESELEFRNLILEFMKMDFVKRLLLELVQMRLNHQNNQTTDCRHELELAYLSIEEGILQSLNIEYYESQPNARFDSRYQVVKKKVLTNNPDANKTICKSIMGGYRFKYPNTYDELGNPKYKVLETEMVEMYVYENKDEY